MRAQWIGRVALAHANNAPLDHRPTTPFSLLPSRPPVDLPKLMFPQDTSLLCPCNG